MAHRVLCGMTRCNPVPAPTCGRPHRTLRLETPTGPPARAGPPRAGRIIARPVLGGLHHEYDWLTA